MFAGVALFVGGFIIFNTFSITVAQRTKEFALLRTMGASGGQVLRSVLLESLVIGLLASALGTVAGIVAAKGISAIFKSAGIDLPSQGTVVETRTIVVAMVVGVLVTLVAGLVPARRATRVPPLAAMREGVSETPTAATPASIARRGVVVGVVLAVVVAVSLLAGAGAGQVLLAALVAAIIVVSRCCDRG